MRSVLYTLASRGGIDGPREYVKKAERMALYQIERCEDRVQTVRGCPKHCADLVRIRRMRGRKAPRGAKEGVWQQGGRAGCVRTKDALHLYQRPVLGTVVGTARQTAWVNKES